MAKISLIFGFVRTLRLRQQFYLRINTIGNDYARFVMHYIAKYMVRRTDFAVQDINCIFFVQLTHTTNYLMIFVSYCVYVFVVSCTSRLNYLGVYVYKTLEPLDF